MDEDIKLPEPVAWAKPNGEDVITSTSKWLWRAAMPAFVDACSVPCFTADQLRDAVEADRVQRVPDRYSADQIAQAAMEAEIPDSKLESLLLALDLDIDAAMKEQYHG